MLDAEHVVHANGHTMSVAVEPLKDLEARVLEETDGKGFTGVRRVAL